MPATCFNRLLRGAGVIAQRCRLSLQGLSEAWLRYARFQPFAASCAHRRATNASTACRTALAPVFTALRLLEPAGLLVSYMPLARLERKAQSRA